VSGANFRLSGRALRVCYENPWAVVARCRPPAAPCAAENGETATAPSLARGPRLDPIGENEKWWTILTEARIFFEQREP
jgi:hypothetical protein